MAPSCVVGHPQRSLVRIPGSGSDRTLKPVCLEIAQITSFYMSDVIPRYQLPPPETPSSGNRTYNIFESRGSSASTNVAAPTHRVNTEIDSSTTRERELSSPTDSSASSSESEDETSEVSRKRSLEETEERQLPNKRSNNNETNKKKKSEYVVDPRMKKIRVLLEDRHQLNKENDELQMKINKFKELLKDKVKLNEFLVAMKELRC